MLFDLGEEMNQIFNQLYTSFAENHSLDLSSLNLQIQSFFDTHQDASWHDKYFHNFSGMWRAFMAHGQYRQAENIWKIALEPVTQWEQQNQTCRIHKGAAYYYWGITTILGRDLDQGFLVMHQALEEDRQTHGTLTGPSLAFVTLDDSVPEVFQPKIKEICVYLEQLLKTYRDERGMALDINQFRSKFLNSPDLQDYVYLFTYTLFRFYSLLEEVPRQVTRSFFAGQLSVNLLFDLCLIIEGIIKSKITQATKFKTCGIKLADKANLNNLKTEAAWEIAQREVKDDTKKSLTAVLDGSFNINTTNLSDIEGDLILAYGFRNHGGHQVNSYGFVYERLQEIFQRIMNILFLSCEEML